MKLLKAESVKKARELIEFSLIIFLILALPAVFGFLIFGAFGLLLGLTIGGMIFLLYLYTTGKL